MRIQPLKAGVKKQPLAKRLFWLVAIWVGSVLALFVVASLFRLMMTAAGLKVH
ncbi:hypothetical protein J9874_01761 [Duffyella gerundensis]|jgi:hypothetical protein|uniref:Putative membrane protein n=1 Tax=Duffyella gerundensis TaxID=1619313 RepID=A0A0U5KZS5_9GAMM|nr:DUF2474 domain-containing protein [Duffyella gerundensis]QTO52737.1 DUF2474 domain-containing protein [Duffyella gerundensis]UCB31225.1 hypothetical protein J9874_01761 [Duffyella gerundensis]CUU23866.1 putative membrane protein [Duffyella gerundensis]